LKPQKEWIRNYSFEIKKVLAAEFAPRPANRKFDHDPSASAIGIFHDNVKVAVGGLFCLTVC
jgi:hypothetical protein